MLKAVSVTGTRKGIYFYVSSQLLEMSNNDIIRIFFVNRYWNRIYLYLLTYHSGIVHTGYHNRLVGTKQEFPRLVFNVNNMCGQTFKGLKVIWRADKNDKWLCLLLEAVKIITYIKPSTVRLHGAISQEGTCLNYRTGNGNDSNCH